MPFPLSITITDPGAGGVPTTNNPRNLAGWVEDYSDSICLGFGCEMLRLTGTARSREEAADWVGRLMSSVEVYTPTGRLRFSGFLNEVVLPSFDAAVSLTNMANAILVRWGDPDGKQGTTTVTNAGSIAKYGRKERILNESISLEADATNRASMILAQIAEPLNKETVTTEKGDDKAFPVQLVFVGWAEALKWLTTTSTTETTQASTTQVTGLLTTYNATNAFFDLTNATITATGHAATQFCPPDTTYLERIDKLLSFGDTSQRRIAWGFYGRAITIAVAATSAPETITYNYSKRAGRLWTTEGNFIDPWDWTPDVMVQNVDVIGPAPAAGAIASLTRKYIKRATLRIDKSGVSSGTLEPDDVDSLAEWVANPVSKNTGISQRHQIAEARIRDAISSRTIRTDNDNLWNSGIGVLRPEAGGTGKVNTGTIDTGGGNITFPPGGGTGITGSGTVPRVARWTTDATLEAAPLLMSGAGPLTLSAATAVSLAVNSTSSLDLEGGLITMDAARTLTITADGSLDLNGFTLTLDGDLRADGSGAATGDALVYDGAAFVATALVAADVDAAPNDAKYIVQQAHAGLSAEQALGALATGILKNTTTTGVLSIAVAGTDYAAASHTHTYIDGSGITGRAAQFADSDTIEASTMAKTGAGVLTFSVASTQTVTFAGSSGGTINFQAAGKTLAIASTSSIDLEGGLIIMDSAHTFTITGDGSIDLANKTLLMAGAGSALTLSVAGAYTFTIPKTGTAVTGVGVTNRIPYFSDANTLSTNADFTFDGASMVIKYLNAGTASGAREGEVLTKGTWAGFAFTDRGSANIWTWYANSGVARLHDGTQDVLFFNKTNTNLGIGATPNSAFALDVTGSARFIGGTIRTSSGFDWGLSSYVAGGFTGTGYVQISINGTAYKLAAST